MRGDEIKEPSLRAQNFTLDSVEASWFLEKQSIKVSTALNYPRGGGG